MRVFSIALVVELVWTTSYITSRNGSLWLLKECQKRILKTSRQLKNDELDYDSREALQSWHWKAIQGFRGFLDI
jgi:hypothetical protein